MIALLPMCFLSSRDRVMIDCGALADVVENALDGVGATAAFRRAAERGIDAAHSRARRPCNGGFHQSLTQNVAATDDHDAVPWLNNRTRIMISSSPLTAPLQAAARASDASADMPANTCDLRINIRFLRRAPLFDCAVVVRTTDNH
jgi:hypothetical protein